MTSSRFDFGSTSKTLNLSFLRFNEMSGSENLLPIEVMDEGSPSWYKGRIFYIDAQKEVVEAFATNLRVIYNLECPICHPN